MLRAWNDEIEQLIIFDPAGHAIVAFANIEQDGVIRLKSLGTVERATHYFDVLIIGRVFTERVEQIVPPKDKNFEFVAA